MHQTDNINLPQFVNLGGGNLNRALIVQHQLFTTPIKNRSSLLISPKQFNYKESLKQQNLFNLANLQAPILKEEIKKNYPHTHRKTTLFISRYYSEICVGLFVANFAIL
jgi:hypothetical protein